MRVISGRNVNDIYPVARGYLEEVGVRQQSRAGEVLVAPHPVMSVYERPWERVLFDEDRDCNPFFHMMESIWMLSGSRDGRWLDRYLSDFSARYGQENGTIHGAYGDRWRRHFEKDQLDAVVGLLRADHTDRQAVVQMWDADSDLGVSGLRDRPCNTHIYLRVVPDGVLDMSVMCRSNDIIWGAYGANCVHFSVLLEYLSARIGVTMGRLYQYSWNWHGYSDVLARKPWKEYDDPYFCGDVSASAMFHEPDRIDDDVRVFYVDPVGASVYINPWFNHTARPMALAHHAWRNGRLDEALGVMGDVQSADWRIAGREWLERRRK